MHRWYKFTKVPQKTKQKKTPHVYNFFFIIQGVKAHVIPCPHQPPNSGNNTVSVAQGGTATPATTK